jgi:uncharacterized membrane protein
MKWQFKRDVFALSVIAISLVGSIFFAPLLPDTMPMHFNSQGIPDSTASKAYFLIFTCGLNIGLYLLLTFIPLVDPFRKKFEARYQIFLLIRDLMVAFSLAMTIIIAISSRQGHLQTDLFSIAFGLLFIVLGNYLPRLPQNFFFGIRSPWTLASETVWVKTHRISGFLFVIAGAILIALSLLQFDFSVVMPMVLIPLVGFTALLYPYLLFRKLQKEGKA